MILLLGGTSDTAAIASALAEAGFMVLVSTATDEPPNLPQCPSISRRCGRLDAPAMRELVQQRAIRAIVDAAHPYAQLTHETALSVAKELGIPHLQFTRSGNDWTGADDVHFAPDHLSAAKLAFSFGRPVLLTTGANNIAPYAQESQRTGVALVARVLPRQESLDACRKAGLDDGRIIAARGPFTLEQNLSHLREHHIGTLVTKDSGSAGGVPAKLQAARQLHCQIVVIARPPLQGSTFADIGELVGRLGKLLQPPVAPDHAL